MHILIKCPGLRCALENIFFFSSKKMHSVGHPNRQSRLCANQAVRQHNPFHTGNHDRISVSNITTTILRIFLLACIFVDGVQAGSRLMELEEDLGMPSMIFVEQIVKHNLSSEYSYILRRYYMDLTFLINRAYYCNDGSRPGYHFKIII